MIVSRGSFLRACCAGLIGGCLPRWAIAGGGGSGVAAGVPAAQGAARFSPHVGSVFTVVETGHTLRLRDVTESTISPGVEQFALHFSGSADAPLEHGLYTFHYGSRTSIDMFITPVGAATGTPIYEACFSRIVQAKEQSWQTSS